MNFKDNGKKIELTFEVDKNSVLYHLVHRSGMKEEQVQKLFENNQGFREKYLKLVIKMAQDHIENSLDEIEEVSQFAEKTEKSLVKKLKIK